MPRRRRIIDWNSPDGIDPDTPVADLHDTDDAGRDALVLFSDEERQGTAWLLDRFSGEEWRARLDWVLRRAGVEQEVVRVRTEKRRWHEQLWARTTIVLGALAAAGSMLAQWVQLIRGR